MPGMFDWVDPTREALQKYLRGRTDFLAEMPGALYSLATDPQARERAMLENRRKYGEPFTVGTPEQQAAQNDMVQSFWNPAGMFGMTKGALPKLAKAAEKTDFVTGVPARAVGFHGSPSPDVSFDQSKPAFLSSRADVANDYTATRGLWRRMPEEGATVYPASVEFKNPLVIDAMGKRHDNIPVPWQEWKPKVFGNLPKNALSVNQLAEIAKANGHDGLIVKNVIDTADIDGKLKSTVYAALGPDSIKGFFSK